MIELTMLTPEKHKKPILINPDNVITVEPFWIGVSPDPSEGAQLKLTDGHRFVVWEGYDRVKALLQGHNPQLLTEEAPKPVQDAIPSISVSHHSQ